MDGSSARYTYDATGRKLRAEYLKAGTQDNLRTDYCGNLIYEQGRPKMLLVDGGYVTFNDNVNSNDTLSFGDGWGGASYHYYLTDHLGNNRVVVGENDSIEQVNHYYPYGGLMAESTGGDTQRYKYNGKELDRMHGLDWFDYGARWMNGLTFMTPDPLGCQRPNVTLYAYCDNNPVNAIDPDGLFPRWNGKTGSETRYYDSETNEELSWNQVNNYIHTGNYEGTRTLEHPTSESSHTITPYRVGVEWLTGRGERNRTFVSGDVFTEMLKGHQHIKEITLVSTK